MKLVNMTVFTDMGSCDVYINVNCITCLMKDDDTGHFKVYLSDGMSYSIESITREKPAKNGVIKEKRSVFLDLKDLVDFIG